MQNDRFVSNELQSPAPPHCNRNEALGVFAQVFNQDEARLQARWQCRWIIDVSIRVTAAAVIAAAAAMTDNLQAGGADCPGDGALRFGIEPFDTAVRLMPIYEHIGALIGEKIGCPVRIFVTTSYNAEIEAMRADKLDIGEFGPLAYVFAHKLAKADAVAGFGNAQGKPNTYTANIATYRGSDIKTLADIRGHSFAFSDPVSTSGHLFPAYGLLEAGLDPNRDIKAFYAGSHTASFEALYNHKVDAGELNSEQLEAAKERGHYHEGDFVFLWQSDAIPTDPIAIRRNLPEDFKRRLTEVLQNLDLAPLGDDERRPIGMSSARLVPRTDAAYDGIRDRVNILKIDLRKLE
jgi:phosphonate transport system substrate-binding protein